MSATRAEVAAGGAGFRSARRRVSAALFRRGWLRATLLLSAPGAWFVLIYLAALAILFVSRVLERRLVHRRRRPRLEPRQLQDDRRAEPTYRTIALRTIGIAAAVTITDALLAIPFAYFAARLAPRRLQTVLFVIVLVPLWTSYLVRVYAWRLILAQDGILNWTLTSSGFGGVDIAYSNWAMWIVFSYLWLPFMILPVWVAFERVPAVVPGGERGPRRARLDDVPPRAAAAGAAGRRRRLDLHLLADARRLHHADARRRGRLGLHRQRRLPLRRDREQRAVRGRAATIPLVVMGIYLLVARRLGAFEAL